MLIINEGGVLKYIEFERKRKFKIVFLLCVWEIQSIFDTSNGNCDIIGLYINPLRENFPK
jgi:hypothetical protein